MTGIPKRCRANAERTPTLTPDEIKAWLPEVRLWTWSGLQGHSLMRSVFVEQGYTEASWIIARALAPLFEREGHYADVTVYRYVSDGWHTSLRLSLTTHVDGPRLTVNDFVMARLIDDVLRTCHGVAPK